MLNPYNSGSLNVVSSLLGGITVPLPEHALAHRRCPAQTVLVKLGPIAMHLMPGSAHPQLQKENLAGGALQKTR